MQVVRRLDEFRCLATCTKYVRGRSTADHRHKKILSHSERGIRKEHQSAIFTITKKTLYLKFVHDRKLWQEPISITIIIIIIINNIIKKKGSQQYRKGLLGEILKYVQYN